MRHPPRRGRDNIFVLRERRATSCLLFRPRSVLSVYSETSASHETVCLSPFPSPTHSLFPAPERGAFSSFRLFRTCLYLSIYLSASMSLYFQLLVSLSAAVVPYRPLSADVPRALARLSLRFSFIKLIAPTKPKKHVVWGVTREYRVGKHGNIDRP